VSVPGHSSAGNGNGIEEDTTRHVYVHIPFCARICPYCAFYKDLIDRSQTSQFCEAVLQELTGQVAAINLRASTIYFGGGTPTALTTEQLQRLLGGFRDILDLSDLEEWTIEANPGSVSARKAALLEAHGVNRISLGVQSWDDDLLKVLGREHTAAQAQTSFELLRDAGFKNINIDLMFGLPGQTTEQWAASLAHTIALRPDHISTYCLTYEEDTEFFRRSLAGELQADHDLEARLFDLTASTLEGNGYEQYEISNYARRGWESVHNRAYWSGANYLGIGPSAFSTIAGQRRQNLCDYRAYTARTIQGESAVASMEILTPAMRQTERIALLLRTRDGVPADLIRDRDAAVEEFVSLGLLVSTNNRVVLTRAGRRLTDTVAEALV
jgi:oxygen-independent coproporphyrinogen-3 oxidase